MDSYCFVELLITSKQLMLLLFYIRYNILYTLYRNRKRYINPSMTLYINIAVSVKEHTAFGNFSRHNLIKIYTKMHHIFKIFSGN